MIQGTLNKATEGLWVWINETSQNLWQEAKAKCQSQQL